VRYFRKNPKYRVIRRALKKSYDRSTLERILFSAEEHYIRLLRQCSYETPGEWMHLSDTILPTAAVYKALLETDPDNALAIIYGAIIRLCKKGNRLLRGLLHVPGMKGLFMHLLPKMALGMFGRDCGFGYAHYYADSTRLEMDITRCPYCKHAALLGVEALIPTFCESDFATYGSLPGIRFERTSTLGTGGDKCDFRFIRE